MKSFRVIVKEIHYSEAVIVADNEHQANLIAMNQTIDCFFPLQDVDGFDIESVEEIEEFV